MTVGQSSKGRVETGAGARLVRPGMSPLLGAPYYPGPNHPKFSSSIFRRTRERHGFKPLSNDWLVNSFTLNVGLITFVII